MSDTSIKIPLNIVLCINYPTNYWNTNLTPFSYDVKTKQTLLSTCNPVYLNTSTSGVSNGKHEAWN